MSNKRAKDVWTVGCGRSGVDVRVWTVIHICHRKYNTALQSAVTSCLPPPLSPPSPVLTGEMHGVAMRPIVPPALPPPVTPPPPVFTGEMQALLQNRMIKVGKPFAKAVQAADQAVQVKAQAGGGAGGGGSSRPATLLYQSAAMSAQAAQEATLANTMPR